MTAVFKVVLLGVAPILVDFKGRYYFNPVWKYWHSLLSNESLAVNIQPFAMMPVSYSGYLVPPSWQLGKCKWHVNQSSGLPTQTVTSEI